MKKSMYIDPFKTEDVQYWSRKWQITPAQLFSAMMNTGSSHIHILKQTVKNNDRFTFFKSILRFLSERV